MTNQHPKYRATRSLDALKKTTAFFSGKELLFNESSNEIVILKSELTFADVQEHIKSDFLPGFKSWCIDYMLSDLSKRYSLLYKGALSSHFSNEIKGYEVAKGKIFTLYNLVANINGEAEKREFCEKLLDRLFTIEDWVSYIQNSIWRRSVFSYGLLIFLHPKFTSVNLENILSQIIGVVDELALETDINKLISKVEMGELISLFLHTHRGSAGRFKSICAILLGYGVHPNLWLLPAVRLSSKHLSKSINICNDLNTTGFSMRGGDRLGNWYLLTRRSTMSRFDDIPLNILDLLSVEDEANLPAAACYGLRSVVKFLNDKYSASGKVFPLNAVNKNVADATKTNRDWDLTLFEGYSYTPEWRNFITLFMEGNQSGQKSKRRIVSSLVRWAVNTRAFQSPWDIKPYDLKGSGVSSHSTFFAHLKNNGNTSKTNTSKWCAAKLMFATVVSAMKVDPDCSNDSGLTVNPFYDLVTPSFGSSGRGRKTPRARLLPEIGEVILDVLLSPDDEGKLTFAWAKEWSEKTPKGRGDHFEWTNPESDETERIWCPSRAASLAELMLIPIRGVQSRWQCQGLMDAEYYDSVSGCMIKNNHPLSSFTYTDGQTHLEKYGRSSGVLTFDEDVITHESELSIFINTNKTQLWNPEIRTGYVIPWPYHKNASESALKWLNRIYDVLFYQRSWMERYDPYPTPLRFDHTLEDKCRVPEGEALNTLPFFVPLFRDIQNEVSYDYDGKTHHALAPISKGKLEALYTDLMLEVEKRLSDAKGYEITLTQKTAGSKGEIVKPIFDIHSLRVAGISRLIDLGMPAHIVMEYVAGHQALATTLHYFKTNPALMREKIIEAALNGDMIDGVESIYDKFDTLMDAQQSLVQPSRNAPYMPDDALPENYAMLASVEGGLCPMGGHGSPSCLEGMAFEQDFEYGGRKGGSDTRTEYTQVVGGCSNCRFWMTGPDFILQQTLELNRVMIEMRARGRERKAIKSAIADLEWDLGCLQSVDAFKKERLQNEITIATSRLSSLDEKLTPLIQGWCNRHESLELSKEKYDELKASGSLGKELVLIKNDVDIDFTPEMIETTDFGLVRTFIEQARIYKRKAIPLPDEPARMLREFVDCIMVHESPRHLLATIPNKDLATHAASIIAGTMSDMMGDDAVQKAIDTGEPLALPDDQREGLIKLMQILHRQAKNRELPSIRSALDDMPGLSVLEAVTDD